MPEITLTDAEREKLERVHDAHFAGHIDRATDAAWTVEFVTAALAAVPRLALASPMVGELVEKAWREGYDTGNDPAWCDKRLLRAKVDAFSHQPAAADYFWNESEAKAALTGEEGSPP